MTDEVARIAAALAAVDRQIIAEHPEIETELFTPGDEQGRQDYAAALYAAGLRVASDVDVERLARVRYWIIDDIGSALSRELGQGNPFEPFDRTYVLKTITRVLDAARDRVAVAAGPLRPVDAAGDATNYGVAPEDRA